MTLLRGKPDYAGESYNNVDTYSGTQGAAYTAAQNFTKPCKEVILIAKARGGKFKLSPDGTNWSDEIELCANTAMTVAFEAYAFMVKRAGNCGNVQWVVMGFYQE